MRATEGESRKGPAKGVWGETQKEGCALEVRGLCFSTFQLDTAWGHSLCSVLM